MSEKKGIEWGVISAAFYVAAQVLANVASSKIAMVPGTMWATDGGTIVYPLTFTLRDMLHKSLGKRVARQVVVAAGLFSLFATFVFWVVGKLPGDPAWAGNQMAYEIILLPVLRITTASVVAQVVSELVDTEVFSIVMHKFMLMGDTLGVLFSNLISLVVDSLLFTLIAFAGNVPVRVLVQIMLTNMFIKLVMSVVTTPAIWLVKRKVPLEEI